MKDLTKLDLDKITSSGYFSRPCISEFRDGKIILTIGELYDAWQQYRNGR